MNGIFFMNPEEASNKARSMRTTAANLEELFNKVSAEINKIDNVETGMYQGNKKPAQLRAELEDFRKDFVLARDQIINFADWVETTAKVMMEQ